ncbi:ORF6N domain-containing protein [Pseudomonas lundensis]|uniref:ORF6N domain-containing protein n=1 Tax=Pseudomonas lundensis TaxID=86185 RepID=UPI00089DCE93|nr:ORF6N domain-containing protein [Pseudomonas lundensis]
MNNSTAVTVDNLPAITHAGRPVVTTALLAKLYGTDDHNIIKNYISNDGRFVAGKHFHKLEGPELKDFKDKVTQSDVVNKRAKHLILWTERGAARHAKMLDTDEAWEVFEKLEDSYFGKAAVLAIEYKPEPLSPAHQRHIQNRVAELAGMDRKKYPAVWRGIKDHFQVGTYKDIPDSQYPAVCAFMLCKPIDGEIPTAKVIEQATPSALELWDFNSPISTLAARRDDMMTVRNSERAWLDVSLHDLRDIRGEGTPLETLLWSLDKAGFDIGGAWWELRTYRNKLQELTSSVKGLNRLVEDPKRYAVNPAGGI